MMVAVRTSICGLLLLAGSAGAAPVSLSQHAQKGNQNGKAQTQDRSITQVVKLLQDLLEGSKTEGDTERKLYGKYKCYCDTNEASKTKEIDELKQQIGLLGSSIEELQASSGKLSEEVARLDKDMASNQASRTEAQAIRDKENEEFVATEADLVQAVDQMKQAIDMLSAIGADQTMNSAADHAQYMAGHEANLAAMKTTIRKAMLAALAFASDKQAKSMNTFIQAPFTGTYSSQSGEVVGILKEMRDTFSANLKSSREAEEKAASAHTKYMSAMSKAYNEMGKSTQLKQGLLSSNDGILGDKKTQLADSQASLAEAEDFVVKLVDMWSDKKTQYEERVSLRASEQTAIAECIAILNSDKAFEAFGKVAATSTGAAGAQFIQLSAVHRHRAGAAAAQAPEVTARAKAVAFLQKRSGTKGSSLLGRVVAMLKANNPFAIVLEEIGKMISLIEEEEVADDKQKAWCDSEREKTNGDISTKTGQLDALQAEIDETTAAIEDPETGLKVSILQSDEAKTTNYENQVSETKDRTVDNLAYQGNIGNLVEAEALLERAVSVLQAYYKRFSEELKDSLLQKKRDDPAPPETWDDNFKAQSEGGNSAVSMLEFILSETQKEEQMAHTQENEAQHAFEDSMTSLKSEEQTLIESLAAMKLELAEKEKSLIEKKSDHELTTEEVAALETYLEKIKPGCDFITSSLDGRKASRVEERQALETAVTFLKQTPVYRDALEAARQEGLGKCKEICADNDLHVNCKSCLAGISVPGYCAGHGSAEGC